MIYFDNAATSFKKPPTVVGEVYRCMTEYCGNPGRSGHILSLAAAKKVFECRCELSELFGTDSPEGIVFTQNTTHALNLVIKGLLKRGDHVIISDMEHNSVLRPIARLFEDGLIEYSVFSTRVLEGNRNSSLICSNIARKIRPNTRAVICSHSSNICSATLPISEIGAFCRRRGILFIVDAAQSAGHLPINMRQMNIDALCAPAHKALYGIQGLGFAVLGERLRGELDTLTEGGNGINSLELFMPDASPERYEAGTLATPAIAGLCEGVRHVRRLGIENIHSYESSLYLRARELLGNINGVRIYAPDHVGSVLLFNKEGFTPELLAQKLDESGFCVRGGYHCSPLGHKTLGTLESGAVRLSFGIFNKKSELDLLARVLGSL